MADDDHLDHDNDTEAMDPFVLAIGLCRVASSPKTIEAALKKLRKLGRDIETAEQKLAVLQAEAAAIATKLESDVGVLKERERALDARATEFEASLQEARDHLRVYHDSIREEDRRLRYRIMASADLLSGYNAQLQDLPSWDQLKRLIVGLPDDPPPLEREVVAPPRIDLFSDTSDDPHADRQGNAFRGSLSRDVSHRRGAQ
jgi:septal ring factor EnvC (AmiA/AmiB activator)